MTKKRPSTDPKLAVAYIRVSTDKQAEGPEAQRQAIESWARSNGVTVVSWHQDIGVSGAASLSDRPGFLDALAALEESSAGLLVVAKRDRLSRAEPVELAMVERQIERLGAVSVSADGAGNGNDASSLLMRRMVAAFAEYELLIIRARTKAALQAKKARGERTGSIPFGKALAADRKTLVDNHFELAVIAKARALAAVGTSLRAIAKTLNAEGHRSRSGTPFNATQVKRMLAA